MRKKKIESMLKALSMIKIGILLVEGELYAELEHEEHRRTVSRTGKNGKIEKRNS